MEQYSLPGYHLGKVWYYSAGLGVSSTSEERSNPLRYTVLLKNT
jgi:hypothetical protein